ncbi:MAG: hypothetical protein IPP72_04805 [Chitinophagaceae bacterium]|nr:hypothetical protein [Chitinophagaceae bacterium]
MQTTIHLKSILLIFGLLSCSVANAQIPASAFSFSCIKTDTVVGCGQTCVTLSTKIPNIRALTGTYTVNRISAPEGCFRQYVSPAAPGTALGASNDDIYSSVINLPFNFPFYGAGYNSVVISTNGYISFDETKASAFSHYGMFSSGFGLVTYATGGAIPADLPNVLYDKALIMVPYHDIDIFASTSPGKQVKYELIGTAPHRRWVLSYYKIPLFLTSCNNLIENTSQLVLYEGTGIVEVFINSNQSCTGWNEGRSMIGMQDYDRANGIMAPGRAASDAPWGTVDMNEAWRFTPAEGATLFKRVELYDAGGQLVSTGSILDAGNGNYNATFNNVCIDSAGSYIVKSVYKNINNPLTEVYGTDTLNILKRPANASELIWTGSVSTQWENPLNWLCNTLPGSTSSVIINAGAAVVVNSNVTVNSVTVQPGASLIVNPGYNINVLSAPH